VLIANAFSLISAGTEKMAMDLAQKSLLGKARERPDQVRRVLEKVKNEGLLNTMAQVRAKLDDPMTMGYSSAGVVLACGPGVEEFKPGDRVASNGPHAEVVCVPKHLCAKVPEGLPLDRAAFTVLGAVALQGVRLARLEIGSTALVVGLGLIGQLTVALLKASGVRVIGTDLEEGKCALALPMGASVARPGLTPAAIEDLTGGLGADAVVITASTASNGPIELAAGAVRKKGRIVLVGVVGLELDRRPFYFKECEFVVSCSYGAGRYDALYEERGQDYPAAYVRWTEQRNMQAVLELMARGALDVSPLISHRLPIERAEEAYGLIESAREPYVGVVLEYPAAADVDRPESGVAAGSHRPGIGRKDAAATEDGCRGAAGTVDERSGRFPSAEKTGRKDAAATAEKVGKVGLGVLGAGNFAKMVLLPAALKSGLYEPLVIASQSGLSASHVGQRLGFKEAVSDEASVLGRADVNAVFVVTRHSQHARQVAAALDAGKSVFVEKPLAVTIEELARIEEAVGRAPDSLLMVGFNRRFSPAARAVKAFMAETSAPLTVSVRMNAGAIPADHWTQDPAEGGRIIGEACHAIDLATYLTGSLPVRVYAESVGGATAPGITDDQCFITLRHANGSISNIAYLAGGDKAFPKERVEVIGGGRVAVIEDFRKAFSVAGGKSRTLWSGAQDKGHRAEVEAFARAVRAGGAWPIAWEELRAVTLASFLTVQSLREGVAFQM
jgi:predicted dehydrogenase/threonine dehydrogenase-like Zn-dependent dehydrogenase